MFPSKLRKEEPAPDRSPGLLEASSLYLTPVLAGRYDRFCSQCNCIIERFALEKFRGIKCSRCHQEVEFIDQSDGLYRRCVVCSVFVRCTAKFCSMCGRANQHFDPQKPARLQKALELKLTDKIKYELEEGKELSQSCVNDGEFGENSESLTNGSSAGDSVQENETKE